MNHGHQFPAGVAQLVERQISNLDVEGSTPFARSNFTPGQLGSGAGTCPSHSPIGRWGDMGGGQGCSSEVEQPDCGFVAGSIPASQVFIKRRGGRPSSRRGSSRER